MRGSITASAALHLAVIAAAWVGLPQLFEPKDVEETPIVVELVTVAEVTTGRPQPPRVAEAKPPEPDPPPPPPPAPPPPPPPPTPPPPKVEVPPPPAQVAALPDPAPRPEPPKPEPAPEPIKVEKKPEPPKPEPPKPAEVKPEPPKPVARPAVKPAPPQPPKPEPPKVEAKPEPKTSDFDPTRIAALLDRTRRPAPADPRPPDPAAKPVPPAPPQPTNVSNLTTTEPLTMSEIDAIKRQIQDCWNVPAGARDARDMVVRIRFNLNQDGSLLGVPQIIDTARMGDDAYRAMAESALRAVRLCSPLKYLPPGKYERWREVTLTFNPREMLGG